MGRFSSVPSNRADRSSSGTLGIRRADLDFAQRQPFCGTTSSSRHPEESHMDAGARSRNRTGTPLLARDFKSRVSTSFTIRAARGF